MIALETGGACDFSSTELGTRVTVANAGDADAGPFVIQVGDAQQRVPNGLAAGQTTPVWFARAAYGSETTVIVDATRQIDESNEDNNTFWQMVPIPTLPPTCTPDLTGKRTETAAPKATPLPVLSQTPRPTPTPTNTSRPRQIVSVREGQITIPTYPYAKFAVQAWSEAFRLSYAVLDRAAYEASGPMPAAVIYRTLTMENEYLRLTFLPELGGRLYEVIFKPTGHRETYRNPVLKPSPWGPPEQGWWLAAGGLEWCLPVEEHGYEWGASWTAQVSRDDVGATVTLRDTSANDRVRAEIAVRLEAGAGCFTIRPRLENPTGAPLAVKYWTNAMLAPGGENAPSANLRFVLPDAVTSVTIHSRGDDALPGYGKRMDWPVFNGQDLSRLGNWSGWLGFFEDPAVGDFVAVYDMSYDEGLVRVFPASVARGVKSFGLGWSEPIPATNWTDDGSSYVELHGGPAPTFDDSVTLPAEGTLQWTETWYPVAGLGGLRYANEVAALNLAAGNGEVQMAVAVARPLRGDAVLLLNGQERWRASVYLVPGQPMKSSVPLGAEVPQTGRLTLLLEGPGGEIAAEYGADFNLK